MRERDRLLGAQADLVGDRADARFVDVSLCAVRVGRAGGECRAGRQKFTPCHELIVIEGMDWTSPSGRKIVLQEGDITRIRGGRHGQCGQFRAGRRRRRGWRHPPRGRSGDHARTGQIRGAQGGCPTGSAVATGAGNLPAKYVFHAVGPVYRDGRHGEAELLAGCYRKCLELADERARAHHQLSGDQHRGLRLPAAGGGGDRDPRSAAAPGRRNDCRHRNLRTIREIGLRRLRALCRGPQNSRLNVGLCV